MLKDLVKEEIDEINSILMRNEANVPMVEDPIPGILLAHETFMGWYDAVRQPGYSIEDLKDIVEKTYNLQLVLKEIFPNKSGQN